MPRGTVWTRDTYVEALAQEFVAARRKLSAAEMQGTGIGTNAAYRLFPHGGWKEAAAAAWEQAKSELDDSAILERVKQEKLAAVSPDKPLEPKDWREIVAFAQESKKFVLRRQATQTKATISLGNRMCALVFSGDVHFGSLHTEMDAWIKDTDFLLNTPDLYLATLGDEADNFIHFRNMSAVFSQVVSPQLQQITIQGYLEELAKARKLKLAWWGNHTEEFEEKLMGFSYYAKLKRNNATFFAGQGLAEVLVGKQRYTILGTHKARFNSFFNALHSAKRLYQLAYPADIVITAHTHKPCFECYQHYELAREWGKDFGGESFLVRTGTYKTHDLYSLRYFGAGVLGTPTVVLRPDKHQMVMFSSAEQAVAYMHGIKALKSERQNVCADTKPGRKRNAASGKSKGPARRRG